MRGGKVKVAFRAQLFATLWTIQSVEFSRPECWNEPRSPKLLVDSLPAEPQGKPKNTGVGSLSLLSRSSWPRNWTGVSCLEGRFFTNWAIWEAQGEVRDLIFSMGVCHGFSPVMPHGFPRLLGTCEWVTLSSFMLRADGKGASGAGWSVQVRWTRAISVCKGEILSA